jgi:3-oxoadipate enol-lactonase
MSGGRSLRLRTPLNPGWSLDTPRLCPVPEIAGILLTIDLLFRGQDTKLEERSMNKASAMINGHKLAYALDGDQGKPAVVLSHSLATSMEIWGYQLPLLAHRFRVLLYDLRGHGASEITGDSCTLQELASDVAALLDHLQIPRAAFVGLSIGGMVGQVFALRFPDRLSSLVLCSTGCRAEEQMILTIDERISKVRAGGLQSQVKPTLTRWFTPPFIEEAAGTMAWVSDQILSTSVDGYVGCSRAIQGLDVLDALPAIRAKTLLIPAEQDSGFPESISRKIQQKIAGAELILLKNAAHIGNVERAHAFNEILIDFLSRTLN